MSHLLLDMDTIVDFCLQKEPHFSCLRRVMQRAEAEGHQLWIYVGCVQALQKAVAEGLRYQGQVAGKAMTTSEALSRANELLETFTADKHWLSALAEDGQLFRHPNLRHEQLRRALLRLGMKARILTSDVGLLETCAQAITPETYLGEPSSPPKMEFIDLAAQQNTIRPELEKRIHTVLHHGQYIMGPEISELEQKLADFVGVRHAISCSSGTEALLMTLMAYEVGPGDAVFTTPFTFIATAEVISLLGATPVFVDIAPRTFNLDSDRLDLAIEALKYCDTTMHPLPSAGRIKTTPLVPKGIIAVDLFGLPADYDKINAIAAKHGLFVIEDAAQSFGAMYHGRKACTLADVGCTSFFPAKPLGCYGDGGAIFTENEEMAKRITSIRIHGKGADKYDNQRIGLNGRLDTMQAAILLAKLEIFPREIELRQIVAEYYTKELSGRTPSLALPHVPTGSMSAWAQYSIISPQRSSIQQGLGKAGIPTAVYYPKPLHIQTAYSCLGYQADDFPISRNIAQRIFSLPMHPYIDEAQIEKIVSALIDCEGLPI
ncbi:DegT/DnrJ/EryC1/StrS aminotransferase family protein [Desulforhabdus sp. TSK]|uniref:DegT/DnrJ/EryC1/StrS family aminotransferase n=1 Tax=Desulforhabdus sp. TSK TaxID=2925014 RepID=UPI00208066E8|nr:DegT/DnrJ/EryC1/StrS family aminotransferase [Desulforhabdus sp. TSK]GKT10883.1 hypothetical protein DSTSK_41880 [Desulforhabdus sp. TSK]